MGPDPHIEARACAAGIAAHAASVIRASASVAACADSPACRARWLNASARLAEHVSQHRRAAHIQRCRGDREARGDVRRGRVSHQHQQDRHVLPIQARTRPAQSGQGDVGKPAARASDPSGWRSSPETTPTITATPTTHLHQEPVRRPITHKSFFPREVGLAVRTHDVPQLADYVSDRALEVHDRRFTNWPPFPRGQATAGFDRGVTPQRCPRQLPASPCPRKGATSPGQTCNRSVPGLR